MRKEKSCGALVVRRGKNETEILLIKHNGGHWAFPKGHVEAGESEEQTALREVQEETGLTVPPESARLVMTLERNGDCFVDIYLVTHGFALSDVVLLPGETVDAKLVTGEEMLAMWEAGTFVPHSYMREFMQKTE